MSLSLIKDSCFGIRFWLWLVSWLHRRTRVMEDPARPSEFEKGALIEKYGFNRHF